MRLMVIGLDGATFSTLDPWMERGLMPHLSALMARGGRSVMLSTVPPVTAPAWVTCFSGVNSGTHGIYNFVRPGARWGAHIPLSSRDVRVPRLWHHLSRQGLVCNVLDVPLTYPPEPLRGTMVSDLMVAGDAHARTWPPSLQEELRQALGTRFTWAIGDKLEVSQAYLEHLARSVNDKRALDEYILERSPADVHLTVFQHTDVLAHYFWHIWDESHPHHSPALSRQLMPGVLEVVRRIDQAVGALVERAGPEAYVSVVSDHGFGPARCRLHLNDVLLSWGDLVLAPRERLKLHLTRRGLTPSRLAHLARRLDYFGLRQRLRLRDARRAMEVAAHLLPEPDLERSRAWFFHGLSPGLHLSRAAAADQGYVESLIERLRALRQTPSASPCFERVQRREEVYSGAALEAAPDLILQLSEGYLATPELRGEDGFSLALPGQVSGFHRPEGVWTLAGPGVRPGVRLERTDIVQVCPTLLALLDKGVPGMQGRVEGAWLEPELRQKIAPLEPEGSRQGWGTEPGAVGVGGAGRDGGRAEVQSGPSLEELEVGIAEIGQAELLPSVAGENLASPVFDAEEEAAILGRLEALGYL